MGVGIKLADLDYDWSPSSSLRWTFNFKEQDIKMLDIPLCLLLLIPLQPFTSLLSSVLVPSFKMLSAITVLALAVAAQAAPTSNTRATNSFAATAVHNKNNVRNGTASLLKAYAKYNLKPTLEMPAAFMSALSKRQDGSATAVPASGDVEYLVETVVGGQTLNLDFDTGSSDL
jgi:hypothetical protein